MSQIDSYLSSLRGNETNSALNLARLAGILALTPVAGMAAPTLGIHSLPPQRSQYEFVRENGTSSFVGTIRQIRTPIPSPFIAKTSLGQRLMQIRSEAINNGMSLLDADEIEAEIKMRRGERS